MRRLGPILIIFSVCVSVLPRQIAAAPCFYFRTGFQMTDCQSLSAGDLREADPYAVELPVAELVTESTGAPPVRVRCSCDYSLTGSNLLCDYDRNEERSMITEGPASQVCRSGKSLCDRVCSLRIRT